MTFVIVAIPELPNLDIQKSLLCNVLQVTFVMGHGGLEQLSWSTLTPSHLGRNIDAENLFNHVERLLDDVGNWQIVLLHSGISDNISKTSFLWIALDFLEFFFIVFLCFSMGSK